MRGPNSIVSKLHRDIRGLLGRWLSGKDPVSASNQPIEPLRRLFSNAWKEMCGDGQGNPGRLEAHIRYEILNARVGEVSVFVPLLVHALTEKLESWEVGGKFLPYLLCKCPDAQACLALLRPSTVPHAASHFDFSWPSKGIYADNSEFWNWKPANCTLAYMAWVIVDHLDKESSFHGVQNLLGFWKGRGLPKIGIRLWNLLPPCVKLELLSNHCLQALLGDRLQVRLEKSFTASPKGLADFLGVQGIPCLYQVSTGKLLLDRLKWIAIRRELAGPSRWTTMENPTLQGGLSQISRDSDPRLLGILESAKPDVRAWLGIVRGRSNNLAELNRLPLPAFRRLIRANLKWLHKVLKRPLGVNGAGAMEAFLKRLVRIGCAREVLSSLSSAQTPSSITSIFMGMWHLWHHKLPKELSAHLFDYPRTYAFFKAALSKPSSRHQLLQMLRRLPPGQLIWYLEKSGKWFFDELTPLAASLSALCKHAWPNSKGLLLKVFKHASASDLGCYGSEDTPSFWTDSNQRFRKLMDALSGQLTVARAKMMLDGWIDYIDGRNAHSFLELKLQNGRKLGYYVLLWSDGSDRYEDLLAMGGRFWLGHIYKRNPEKYFHQYRAVAGAKNVLPEAFRNKSIGKMMDEVVGTEELLGQLGWVRSQYKATPTVALAYEASLHIGVRYARALFYLAMHRHKSDQPPGKGWSFESFYHEKRIPKKRGGTRVLKIPGRLLKHIQRQILNRGLAKLGLPDSVHGFRSGKNLMTNASPHAGKEIVVNADIREFFPNTTRDAAFGVCLGLSNGRISPQCAGFFADLCCQGGVLPTGAPTSPAISNLVLCQVDRSLEKACSSKGLDYTRYADDLTFSGGQDAVKMLGFASLLLHRKGYELHPEKVNIFRRGRRQMVTGLTVNETPTLPRSTRRRIRAAVHAAFAGRKVFWQGAAVNHQVLRGLLAHLAMTQPEEAQVHIKTLEQCGYFKGRNPQDSNAHG